MGGELVTAQDDLVARWMRAEQAFQIVRLKGKSLRQAAQDLGVSHDTIWRDIRAYEAYLAKTETGSVDEKRAAFLQRVYRSIQMAEEVYDQAKPGSLSRVAALNTVLSAFSHLRAVQGLDIPKDVKPPAPTAIRVQWGGEGE